MGRGAEGPGMLPLPKGWPKNQRPRSPTSGPKHGARGTASGKVVEGAVAILAGLRGGARDRPENGPHSSCGEKEKGWRSNEPREETSNLGGRKQQLGGGVRCQPHGTPFCSFRSWAGATNLRLASRPWRPKPLPIRRPAGTRVDCSWTRRLLFPTLASLPRHPIHRTLFESARGP